ncbi:sugar ABC transporter ATP-binding protein [Brucella sp. NBRC 12950]|uniref:sugar ABC transporter ATP-binding protein n=1 Tax=Brucella sp. NBRC 12950 TaxID=2994518 RepID=UPI0024A188A5|nr:sugar ABC transporter ATP-binding protein [Brucella sp. NBRC 12950]GLU29847.1 sugar ABC transporter ATP-binding protein [Brucella sp. NBRC 12950]
MMRPATGAVGALLHAQNVSKSFGATQALSAFSMSVMPGEIHALIGENGAGKSTFIKILAGIYQPDAGTLRFAPKETERADIAFIHQDLGLISSMTVAENIVLGAGYPKRHGLINWSTASRTAETSLRQLGVELDPRREVADLSVAERALVAIARALTRNARLLVLDEPTATLPGRDVDLLFKVLRHLSAHGIGMIYVSHRLREVLAIASQVTVVRDGLCHHSGPTAGMSEADLISLMSARSDQVIEERNFSPDGSPPVLTLRNITSDGGLRGVDLHVNRGEIVGCVGLRGAGQEELSKALFGLSGPRGRIEFDGRAYRPVSPASSMKQGIVLVSGDRTLTTAGTMNLTENLFLNPRTSSLPSFLRSRRREKETANDVIQKYGVKPADPDAFISDLSGGNAQKLVVARGFDAGPKLVILDEPTAGVDMPTRSALYSLMRRKAREEGVSFLLTSSDHDEVAAVCDRIYVFANGKIGRELECGPFDPETLAQLTHEVAR